MYRRLTWVLLLAAAFVLQSGTAAARKPNDNPASIQAGETAGSVLPPACQRPNLSPRAKARCAFISYTRSLCHRPDLSTNTRLFCTNLRRFASVPLYDVVRLAANGAVRSVHLIETRTGRTVLNAYPYGIAFAAAHADDRLLSMKVKRLRTFLEGRRGPVAAQAPTASGFATGLPIGWNDSTGVAPGQCLNYTINTPSNITQQTSFSAKNTADSVAQQINISATVNGSYAAFKASNTFTFSDKWERSSNSSSRYFNIYSLYNLNSTVDTDTPLNAQGQGADKSFDTLCGNKYMSSVPVGMVVNMSVNYGSSSSQTETKINNEFELNHTLGSIESAVEVATQYSDSSSYFIFTVNIWGGGGASTVDINDAFAARDPTTNTPYFELCAQENTDACGKFTGNMAAGASDAIKDFNGEVDALNGASAPNLSFLQTFPNGVAGATTTPMVTTDIPSSTADDVFASLSGPLKSYVNLMNQLATLRNRTNSLSELLVKTPAFNPVTLLDVLSYLNPLHTTYSDDFNAVRDDLGTCLDASSTDVKHVCQDIKTDDGLTAFDWYGGKGDGTINRFAQQNTLALQYTAVDGATPLDVLYIDKLPSFTAADSDIPIAGQAALIGFRDRPPAAGSPTPFIDILALEPGEPISTENLSDQITTDDGTDFTVWGISAYTNLGLRLRPYENSYFTTNACSPTFNALCAINYLKGGYESVQNRGIQGGLF